MNKPVDAQDVVRKIQQAKAQGAGQQQMNLPKPEDCPDMLCEGCGSEVFIQTFCFKALSVLQAPCFALTFDDPDAPAGTWIHWVLYNIPADASDLPEGVLADAELPDGSLNGENSWRRMGYGGPCPPRGTHRYVFHLYALDTALDLEAGAGEKQLLQAMEGHILAQAELMGPYTRP